MKVRISDHALIRYCERVADMDMESIRRNPAEQVGDVPAGMTFRKIVGDVTFAIDDGCVTTIMTKTGDAAYQTPRHRKARMKARRRREAAE